MKAHNDLEESIASSLHRSLDNQHGLYPAWGMSPQSARSMLPTRRFALGLSARRFVIASLAVVLVAGALGFLGLHTAFGPSAAGGGGVNAWAVARLANGELVAVGGTDDATGSLVVAHSSDAGATWSVSNPGGPALTGLASAGPRLIGSRQCIEQIAGSADGSPSRVPAPTSCLFESTDGGQTWSDLGAGRLVDPSFADAGHGVAHSPTDFLAGSPSRLAVTSDGGRSWSDKPSPCPAQIPWIVQAVAVSATESLELCVAGHSELDFAHWEIVDANGRVLARPGEQGLGDGLEIYRFAAFSRGRILLFGDTTFASSDAGAHWTETAAVGSRVVGGSFTDTNVGYFATRESGVSTGVVSTHDGGSSWQQLVSWPFSSR